MIVETLVCLGLKGNGEPRAHQQEGQCTSAGGGPPVPVTRELNSSTLEELVGHIAITKAEQQTIFVCLMIQITSFIGVKLTAMDMSMESNTQYEVATHLLVLTTRMLPVLFATPVPETQYSQFLQS